MTPGKCFAAEKWHVASKNNMPFESGDYLVLEGEDLCPSVARFYLPNERFYLNEAPNTGTNPEDRLLFDMLENFAIIQSAGFYVEDTEKHKPRELTDIQFWAEINLPRIEIVLRTIGR